MALLILIPLLGFILFWQRVTTSRSSSAALHATSAVLLILYLGGLVDQLLTTSTLLLAGGSFLAIYEVANLLRHRKPLPTPLGLFLFLSVVFFLLNHDASLYMYDEFSHWGIFLKDMLVADTFWGKDSNAMVLRYPPGTPLWQYFFLRLTEFTEGNAYLAQFCLLMPPLLVLWHGLKWQQLYWVISVLALITLALANFGHSFASLYVDHLLGAWFAGTIFNFLLDLEDRSRSQLLSYVLPVTTLILIKDAGLFFAAAAIGILAALVFWRETFSASGEKNMGKGLTGAGTLIFVCIVSSGLITAAWNANRNAAGIPQSTFSSLGIVSGIATGKSELNADAQIELSRRFREVVLNQQVSKNAVFTEHGEFNYFLMDKFPEKFRLTTLSFMLLFGLWQVIVIFRLVNRGGRWKWAIASTGLTLTTICYIGVLFLSYHFAFEERRMILPSYLRYVHTALLPMLLFAFLPLLPGFRTEKDRLINLPGGKSISQSGAIFAVILCALYVIETPYLEPVYQGRVSPELRRQMRPLVEQVRDLVEKDARVWIYLPYPDANGLRQRVFLYDMAPVRTRVVTDPEFLNRNSALQEVIAESDYLWFPLEDPKTDEILRSIVGEDLKDFVFRIDRQDGGTNIVALGGVFK
jgi:hypothetical protein